MGSESGTAHTTTSGSGGAAPVTQSGKSARSTPATQSGQAAPPPGSDGPPPPATGSPGPGPASARSADGGRDAPRTLLSRLGDALDGPFVGMVPWILLGVFEGPGRTQWAVLVALVFSLGFIAIDVLRGRSVKLLNVVSVVYFAVLLVVVNVVSAAGLEWIEIWLGEISNITLTVIAIGSMLVRMPFTLQYAREEAPREFWDGPVFLRINYVITAFWAFAFLVSSAAGFYGDFVLGDNNNLWTGWIIQTGAMLVAVQFTAWYPDFAAARAVERAGGTPDEPAPPVSEMITPLTVWFVPIGIISLIADAAPTWLGIAFIVVGAVLGLVLRRDVDRELHAGAG